jgi:WD40 repeat protein
VDFSPDGKTLVTAGGPIRLWNVAFPRDLLSAVCAIAGRSLTRQQWTIYVPSQPFQQACP